MTTVAPSRREGRIYGGVAPAEREARRRRALLAAGLEVFGTEGYRASTVRRVCKEAGLTDRYFYESFASMEALLVAVYQAAMDDFRARLLAALDASVAGPDPRARILAGLECFFRWVEDPRVARVCWQEVLGVSPEVDQLYIETLRGFARTTLDLLREIHPGWRIDEVEAEELAVAVTGALSQAALNWLLGGCRVPRATMISATSRILFGVLAAVEAEAAGAHGS